MIDLREESSSDLKKAKVTAQTDLGRTQRVTLTQAFNPPTFKSTRNFAADEGWASITSSGPSRTSEASPKETAGAT